MRCLVDGQALEVAEHHRQPKLAGQTVDLTVQSPGLFAVEERSNGWRRIRHGRIPRASFDFEMAAASPPHPGLPSCAQGDTVEPVAEELGLTQRPVPTGQHQEHGLKGVLGVVVITQKLPADTKDHRPVTRHQGGESRRSALVGAGGELLEQLRVGEAGGGAAVEEPRELLRQRRRYGVRHALHRFGSRELQSIPQ
jgi:hypothetical protein